MKQEPGRSFHSILQGCSTHASVPDSDDDADLLDLPAKKVHSSESVAPEGANPVHGSEPAATQGENAALVTIRDKEFYFEEGDLVLLVENTIFKACRLRPVL
jgi:hypothetical protein